MKVFWRILLLLIPALLLSCGKSEVSPVLDINTFIVSGGVWSYDDGEPISDVTIYLYGYDSEDWNMLGEPVSKDSTYTSQMGEFKITKFQPLPVTYYKVVAVDRSVLREDRYMYSEKQIYLNYGTSYKSDTKTYELHGLNFFLSK